MLLLIPFLLPHLLLSFSDAATFNIINNCPYTIWPAAVPGGGRELSPSQTWTLPIITNSAASGRIWARTKCAFDAAGKGTCASGDCSGVLSCTANGSPPATVVKYSLNQYGGNDFYEISLVDGYNVPVDITPTGAGNCMAARCTDQNIVTQCPSALRAPGGCRSACDVYKSSNYCCNYKAGSCWPTSYSKFFKNFCPNSNTYTGDDPTSTYTCTSGV
ncbi:Osmotin-like protein OSM34 [Platanthera guangdongensis]|uniref:Osmotin-like protein OSM34 n=1 Tax=Platanthera guangdongensis TaxID=2320717 RepID=A0ABR2MJ13_9ASPA